VKFQDDDEMNRNLQMMLAGLENLGCAEKHGDMGIVPAGMHFSGHLALVLPLYSFLLDQVI